MKSKKSESRNHEPLLSTFARKIGHAAGAVSKMTQELTETLSAAPKAVKKMRVGVKAANSSTKRPRSHGRAKKSNSTSRKRNVKGTANKRSQAISRSSRSGRKAAKTTQ
jgi:hypothetical protein